MFGLSNWRIWLDLKLGKKQRIMEHMLKTAGEILDSELF